MSDPLYRNNLKNQGFGKEGPQNLHSEQALLAERQSPNENTNFEAPPTQPKTDSLSCFGIDTTTTRKNLQEGSLAVNLLEAVLEKVSEGILFLNLEGTLVAVNQRAKILLGIIESDVLNKKFTSLFPNDLFGFSMREALTFGLSYRLLYKEIRGRELEISSTFTQQGSKAEHGLLIVFRDVSERFKLQRILNQQDTLKELGQMVAKVAHEIRNPLGAMRGMTSLLYRDLQSEPHLQELAGCVLEGTHALEKLVSGLLQYARPIPTIELSVIDLSAFVKQIGRFIKMDAAFPSNVELAMHVPNSPLLAPIDPAALKGALLNLLFNALQAMEEGGVLTISLFKQERVGQISICDTGIGMSEELQKQLFSPFFTTKAQGNGIGLVEAKKIIEAHQGKIEVRSHLGVGTTFTITLPLKR